jgi:uncharacterized membrane protein YfcA
MINYLGIALIGTFAGLIAGGLGTSTANAILPGLLMIGVGYDMAAGTTLLAILPPLSIGAMYEYYKRGKINVKYALVLMGVCTLFVWISGKYSYLLADKTRKRLLSGYLAIVAMYLFYSSFHNIKKKTS